LELMTESELETYRMHRRFDRMGRLIGDEGMRRLMNAHVMILGLGGVGSFAAESIVRSGVGEVTLIDFDEICITNFNRQLHALGGLVGKQKAEVMGERLQKINPQLKANILVKFYNEKTAAEIFSRKPDYVIDAIDSVTSKCHLIHYCHSNKIPLVSCMGSGGRLDPSQIRVSDLSETSVDPLARDVRLILRQKYGFPSEGKGKFGIPAVYSIEHPRKPVDLHYDGGKGFRCVCPQGENEFFNCDSRNMIWGNAGFVTGAAGLQMASVVVRGLLAEA